MYTNPIVGIFVFIFILFLYIHITAQWKTSNDLEIYETDYKSPVQLQEICAVKQPVLFSLEKDPFFAKAQLSQMDKYDNYDVAVKNAADYTKEADTVEPVILSLRALRRFLAADNNAKYFSETNGDFLEESGLLPACQKMDDYLKPPLSLYSKYDLLFGSRHTPTPLRYHLYSHRFLLITAGKIRVKMSPPKYRKVFPETKDYEKYEFWTPLNVWADAPRKEHADILAKVKFLEFDIHPGMVLFVPPYWWYSIRYSGDVNTTVFSATYDTIMNAMAQTKPWLLYYLQQSNTTTKLYNPADLSAEDYTQPNANANANTNTNNILVSPQPIAENTPSHSEPAKKTQVTFLEDLPEVPLNEEVLSTLISDLPTSEEMFKRELSKPPRDIITNAGTYTVSGPPASTANSNASEIEYLASQLNK